METSAQDHKMHVAVACGGTGGHVFPGLATADALAKRGHRVTLWLAGKDVERLSVEGWSGTIVRVSAAGFPSGFSLQALSSAFSLITAAAASLRNMRLNRPDVLLAMGGYGAVGPVLAARCLKIPVVLHESNAVPGRAIASLARFSRAVATAFPETADHFEHPRIVFTGFPLSRRIVEASTQIRRGPRKGLGIRNPALDASRFTVLVMGGSQGARVLNETAPEALCKLWREGLSLQAIHIAGRMEEAQARAAYAACGAPHVVFGFLRKMEQAYASADLAVCRAGAATCAELAACGVPALLVPLAGAPRDHQTRNALALQKTGGADMLSQEQLNAGALAEYVAERCRNRGKLEQMRAVLVGRPIVDGAENLAELVERAGASA